MRRPHVLIATALCAAVLLGMLSGCTIKDRALDGTAWKLTAWSVNSVSATAFPITAQFEDGKVSGISAVNTYGGTYAANPDGTMLISELSSTLMAGSDAANRAETAYTGLLSESKRYKRDGRTLTLYDENGNVNLVFEQASW